MRRVIGFAGWTIMAIGLTAPSLTAFLVGACVFVSSLLWAKVYVPKRPTNTTLLTARICIKPACTATSPTIMGRF